MRILLDTHALLWWLADDPRLGRTARDIIADPANDVLVSAVSLWEIALKIRIGKLHGDIDAILNEVARGAFTMLAITPAHLRTLTSLPTHHRDPFDHLLIAQAICEAATFLSDDRHAMLYAAPVARCFS